MIKEGIDRILGLAVPNEITLDGRKYVDKKMETIRPPVQKAIVVSNLEAIRDYFQLNPDNVQIASAIIHVEAHDTVVVESPITDPWLDRHIYMTGRIEHNPYPFERYLDIETFIIKLQTHFVPTETTKLLMAFIGNLTAEATLTLMDDGVTQQAQTKSGIVRVGNAPVPNPVALAPYRTFLDVPQPEGLFTLRLKKTDSGIAAALYEADGGNWKESCKDNVKTWLKKQLPDAQIF